MSSYYEKLLATGEVKCIDEEIPFEIPKGWEWCRVTDLMTKITDGTHRSPTNSDNGEYMYITAKNVKETGISLANVTFVSKDVHDEIYSRCNPEYGDLLYIKDGATTGIVTINTIKEPFSLLSSVALLKPASKINTNYILYFLRTPLNVESVRSSMKGCAITRITLRQIEKWLVPVPPQGEQRRIVALIDELLPYLDKYSVLQRKLDSLNLNINDKLKKAILQEAIQGKLVPQLAEEGTAQELLAQIKAEKQKLFKEGKLKKSAINDSVIFRGDDNRYYEQIGKKCLDITEQIPFDLPESWSWARGMSVFMPMESTKPSSDFVYIDVDAVNNRLNIIDNPKKVRFENAPSRATRKLHKNDLLFSMVRPYLKNIALVDDIYIDAIASTGFYVITPSLGYYPMFLFYLMLSNYVVDGLNAFMKGDNSPSINNCHIEDYLYPLPPIEEQKRIVNKIEQLFKQLR